MTIPFVDLKAQYVSLKSKLDAEIQNVIDKTAFILGKQVTEFEEAFAYYIGTKYAIGVCSGTDALEMALRACNIGIGDEVITVPNTYIATCEAISHVGAIIKWIDVDKRTYNMDPKNIESAITSKTKAIIPVHLYGQPADMHPIVEISKKYGLKIIEDCAQSHGAKYKGQKTGTFGDVACFSFYPGKNLGAYGDGGAVLTNNERIAETIRLLRNHGQKEKYIHLIEGYCHRLDNLQAAILNVKLPFLDKWNENRRKNALLYNKLLLNIPNIIIPYEDPRVEHVYHLYIVQVPARDKLRLWLNEQGIETGIHYPIPLHEQPAYSRFNCKTSDFPISHSISTKILSLPMYPELTNEQIHYIVDSIRIFYNK